ncbi:MAG: phytoene/squalene synthase family protein, partial [Chitinophagaceae bacterium]|nr:phytoene/squalene synthase family protein [Chitinophagaceae bacterium]
MTLSRNRKIYETWSLKTSIMTTKLYSTSFSIGIRMLDKSIRNAVYSIYGFVRLADEIVDTLHEFDKELLLKKFKEDTYFAIENKISTNPILHSFQQVVHQYKIDLELIEQFLHSMEMDLSKKKYSEDEYKTYILGSAEVVGLMCLKIFCNGNQDEYLKLKPAAMKLGAAFQKVNFLRDIHADEEMGRMYFP